MIEFDASKVVIEFNEVEVTGFADTKGHSFPNDSQMLDFMIENGAYINAFHLFGELSCYVMYAHDIERNKSPAEVYKHPTRRNRRRNGKVKKAPNHRGFFITLYFANYPLADHQTRHQAY